MVNSMIEIIINSGDSPVIYVEGCAALNGSNLTLNIHGMHASLYISLQSLKEPMGICLRLSLVILISSDTRSLSLQSLPPHQSSFLPPVIHSYCLQAMQGMNMMF